LELSYLWRLPDGAEMTGENCGCIFSRNVFFDKSKAVKLNFEILIDYRCSAAVTGAKRRTLVAIVMLMFTIFSIADFVFHQMMILWPVNAGNCNEYHDVNG